jgi:aryl-alcohol dehydrogenase-like predicted oxidoreductase
VDTAEAYGAGRSEELVSQAVAGQDDVMVFTKVLFEPFGSGLDAAGIRAGAQASLRRLGREVLDLYQIHLPDPEIPVEESWGAMAQLVDEGLARYIGVSNFPPELVEHCERVRRVDSVQVHFSLLYREDYLSLLPLCRANGTGILTYGPLGFGVLAGAMTPHTRLADEDWRSGNGPLPVQRYGALLPAPPMGLLSCSAFGVNRTPPLRARAGPSSAVKPVTSGVSMRLFRPRACYEPVRRMLVACLRKRQANATK